MCSCEESMGGLCLFYMSDLLLLSHSPIAFISSHPLVRVRACNELPDEAPA